MNTCWVPHLEMSPKCLTMATIALDILCICALIVYNFEQVTVALHSTFWISAVWLLHGWCHVKLLPCWCKVYVHHTAMHQFTVSLYSKLHICMLHVCLAETCHLHFWQNGWDLLYATAVTRVWNKYRNKRQHREENSPTVPARTQTPRPFDHKSTTLPLSHPHSAWYWYPCLFIRPFLTTVNAMHCIFKCCLISPFHKRLKWLRSAQNLD